MIATQRAVSRSALGPRLVGGALTAAFSAVALLAALKLQEMAIWMALFLAVIALALWRPRYGWYALLALTVMFDPKKDDPLAYAGWLFQSNVSTWSSLRFIVFSPAEILAVAIAVAVLARVAVYRRIPALPRQWWLLALFTVLIVGSVGWGAMNGGSLNIALWETRSLFLAVLLAFLAPSLLTDRGQVGRAFDLMSLAAVPLCIDVIWRRFALLRDVQGPGIDLAFAHETPIVMNMIVILVVARLLWRATGRQRLLVFLVPLILLAQMLTERRAGWISLDIGLALIALFIFRLRRRLFLLGVLPLLVLYAGYLAVFWNAQGTIAQPARAVRSLNDPEGRDRNSNIYRLLERMNVRQNVLAHPITGLGFGRPYVFYYSLPDLSAFWPFYRYMAHVSILWLWMKMGPLGFITLLTITGFTIVYGVQILKREAHTRSAPTLVALISLVMMLVVYAYVDLALTNLRSMVLLGFALGTIGAWGAWPAAEGEPDQ
ncbi:MAG: O-antigen ligase family protein [Dehalococcoidia bacterium]